MDEAGGEPFLSRQAFMRACREGGAAIEATLRALDRRFSGVLLRDARRTLKDSEAARDAVQDALIRVWQRCATFQGDSELLPWIRAILRNGILDRLRRPGREVGMERDELDRAAEPDPGTPLVTPRPDEETGRRQMAECFDRCWKRFEAAAPAHAAVLSWIVEDGLSNEQIAELLDRTPGATREFISQCRKKARVHLEEWRQLAFGARRSA